MKNKFLFILIFLLVYSELLTAQDSEIDSLNLYIPEVMQHLETPGLSIAIVKDQEIIYSRGFGTKEINLDEPVDANTLFAIGSISKSFTPLAIGMLIDEGKLHWDDKVVDYVPYFELYDPYVTSSFTIRDLLTHRSGLEWTSGGTLFYHSDLNREEIIKRLKYLEPASEFRTSPAYQNTMFIVASKVVEAVIDESWDDFIRKRIFEPLEMHDTVISEAERNQSKNISSPHIKNDEFEIISIEQEKLDNLAPAGSFYSSANDMANYIKLILNNGIVLQDTLISNESFQELFKPQIHFRFFGKPIHNEFTSYGLGWWLTPKNGNKIVEHSGGVDGMSTNLMVEMKNRIGVIVLANTSFSAIPFVLTFDVLGHLLGDDDYAKISNLIKNNYTTRERLQREEKKELYESRIENTKPSLTQEQYTGVYEDEMYGEIYISLDKQNLKIKFSHTPLFTGILSHWHYDTFKIDWMDPRVPDGLLTFEFNSKGQVNGLNLDQPDLLDVNFSELDIKKKQNN